MTAVHNILKSNVKNPKVKEFLCDSVYSNGSENYQVSSLLLGLAAMLHSSCQGSTIMTSFGKILHFFCNVQAYEEGSARLNKSLQVIGIGSFLTDKEMKDEFYVNAASAKYKFCRLIDALEATLQAYILFNLTYPKECENLYNFLVLQFCNMQNSLYSVKSSKCIDLLNMMKKM